MHLSSVSSFGILEKNVNLGYDVLLRVLDVRKYIFPNPVGRAVLTLDLGMTCRSSAFCFTEMDTYCIYHLVW